MPWVRFDDQFPIHRKTAGLSDAAFRLHVSAIFWCARNLTDGFLPKEDLEDVCARVRTPERFAAELVVRGVWHLGDEQCASDACAAPMKGSGWVIHDYLEYQPSAERVRAERLGNARRQQEWRDRQTEKRNGVSNGSRNALVTPPRPDPSRTSSFQEEEEPHDDEQSSPTPPGTGQQTESIRPEVLRICVHLADRIAEDGSKRPRVGKNWLDAARLMLDRDGLTEEQIHRAIDWCQDDDFWRSNILSLPKLREKYTQLRKQASGRANGAAKPATTDLRAQQADQALAELKAEYAAGTRRPFGLPPAQPQLDFGGLMREIES